MRLLETIAKRIILIVIMLSILLTFMATPASYAKLDLKEGDFYYSGTTTGTYAPSKNIFDWLLGKLGDIADWLIGIATFGFRMIFVGWTALLEKMLTWALESTTGMSTDGSMVESSTDLTALTDSARNVTVEAIVYNKVPALSVDIFDLEYDKTRSGTGMKLICEGCKKPVEECKTASETVIKNAADIATIPCNGVDAEGNACKCNGCDACKMYLLQVRADTPIIIQLRSLVATWYTIIRLLAVAAMLVVLIAVGIKMAISTIASDKAVYSRMLVDWVGGMILIFTLHYFIIFVVHMNGVLVNVIEDSANSINKVSIMQISQDEIEITDSDMEIKIYEELRTRAYDAKASNGMIGMIMYMTMVFFAFKYTIIYIKRLFTIIVLILMAPAVGLAYALQKVLSGKSSALKTWLTEFIMNTIIQVVHALMYAIFISQALILSLHSVGGMVVALILINYTSKADKLFKKIFKFGGGDSLLGHTENALQDSIKSLQNAQGLVMGAKPLAKALTNTPYGKAVKAVGKAALAAPVAGVAAIGAMGKAIFSDPVRQAEEEAAADDEYFDAIGTEEQTSGDDANPIPEDLGAYTDRVDAAIASIRTDGTDPSKEGSDEEDAKASKEMMERALLSASPEDIMQEYKAAQIAFKNANKKDATPKDKRVERDRLKRAYKNTRSYAKLTQATQRKIALGHAQRLFEIKNEFRLTHNGGKRGVGSAVWANAKQAYKGTFGSLYLDRGWKVHRGNEGIYNRFSAENLLGFTPDDKKMFKQHVITPISQGFIGMGTLFLGMATVVAEPKIGMGLLATGVGYTSKTFRKPTGFKSEGKYSFNRYGTLTMNAIKNSAIAEARRERRGITVDHLKSERPSFCEKLADGKIGAVTLGLAFAPVVLPAVAVRNVVKSSADVVRNIKGHSEISTTEMLGEKKERKGPVARFISRTSFAEHLEEIDKHSYSQQRKQEEEFKKEALELMKIQNEAEAEGILEELRMLRESDEYKAQEAAQEKSIYEQLGFVYVKETDTLTSIESTPQRIPTVTDVKEEDLKKFGDESLTSADINSINEELDYVIFLLARGGVIDMNSKAVQSQARKLLNGRLRKLLSDKKVGDIAALFEKGENGLKLALKQRAAEVNKKLATIDSERFETKGEDGKEVVQSLFYEKEPDAGQKKPGAIKKADFLATMDALCKRSEQSGKTSDITVDALLANWKTVTRKVVEVEETEGQGTKLKVQGDGGSPVELTGDAEVTVSDSGNLIYTEVTSAAAPQLSQDERQALEKYISRITRTTTAGLTPNEVKAEAKKLQEDTRRKVEEVAAIALDSYIGDKKLASSSKVTDPELAEATVRDLLSQKGDRVVAGYSLTGREAELASDLVRTLLETTAVNAVAIEDVKLKKGVKSYKSTKTKKAELSMELYELQQDKLRASLDSRVQDAYDKKIEVKQRQVDEVTNKLKSNVVGPIADIDKLIQSGIGRR